MCDCLKGPLPTLMHCAPRTQFPRISRFLKLLVVVRGFSKDLVSGRTALAIRSKKIVILRTTQAIHPRKIAIRSKGSAYPSEKIVIRRSNGSGYPLEKVVIRSDGSVLLQTTFSGAVRDEPVKTNVSFNDLRNSSKRCLPSPHEFSRYIFCWIAFFAFITFDYRYKFYSRLISYKL